MLTRIEEKRSFPTIVNGLLTWLAGTGKCVVGGLGELSLMSSACVSSKITLRRFSDEELLFVLSHQHSNAGVLIFICSSCPYFVLPFLLIPRLPIAIFDLMSMCILNNYSTPV